MRPTSGASVLLVDDDVLFGQVVDDHLSHDGLRIVRAGDLGAARLRLDEHFDVMILDQRLPDGGGLSFVKELREKGHLARVLMVTGHPQVADAVEALHLRIDDYLTKPVELEALRLAVLRSLEACRLERAEHRARRSEGGPRPVRLVGAAMGRVRHLVEIAARCATPVLVTGETGTGKGVVARSIHAQGGSDRPFVKVNCAALPPTLIEAELFGVERGAYTGAQSRREGLFELADGGTLFLDEVGDLDLPLQAKLLGVLEDGRVRRVGGTREVSFSVRVVAATNADLRRAVADKRFRADLLYRLDVLRISVPSLADRVADLEAIVDELLPLLPGGRAARLAEGELDRLAAYPWPGNVRELRNLLERSLLLDPPSCLAPSRLVPVAEGPRRPPPAAGASPVAVPLAEVERHHILQVLADCRGNRTRAAEQLGIGLATLRRKLRSYTSE